VVAPHQAWSAPGRLAAPGGGGRAGTVDERARHLRQRPLRTPLAHRPVWETSLPTTADDSWCRPSSTTASTSPWWRNCWSQEPHDHRRLRQAAKATAARYGSANFSADVWPGITTGRASRARLRDVVDQNLLRCSTYRGADNAQQHWLLRPRCTAGSSCRVWSRSFRGTATAAAMTTVSSARARSPWSCRATPKRPPTRTVSGTKSSPTRSPRGSASTHSRRRSRPTEAPPAQP
jgi:hypothetical protein